MTNTAKAPDYCEAFSGIPAAFKDFKTLEGFTWLEARRHFVCTMFSLAPDIIAGVRLGMDVRTLNDVHKRLSRKNPSEIFIIDPVGQQAVGTISNPDGQAAAGDFVTGYEIGVLGSIRLATDEDPVEVVVPKFQAILTAALHDRARGGFAVNTSPTFTIHSGAQMRPALNFGMGFRISFEWGPCA